MTFVMSIIKSKWERSDILKEKKFLITIIVPIYKTEKYLERCLDSIVNAIDIDCEVILINDGSPDDSEKIIKEYLKRLPSKYANNFVYVKKQNEGLAQTKNLGITMARGKYISVIDSDDTISNNFYNDARPYIKEGYDVIIYDLYVVFEKKPEYNHTSRAIREDKKGFINQIMHGAMLGSSCNKIIKKDLYNYKFPVGKQYEDVAVTPFLLIDAEKIKYIPNPNYYYLQRDKSIVATNSLDNAFYKICENINNVLAEKKDISKYETIINVFYIDRTIDMLDYSLKKNRKKTNNLLKDFQSKNQLVIDYIIQSNLIEKKGAFLTERQYYLLKKIYEHLYEKEFKKVYKLVLFRRIFNWFRCINGMLKQLFKTLIGGIYNG